MIMMMIMKILLFSYQFCSILTTPNAPTRFYTFLGAQLRPLSPETPCERSTPGLCSCEPIFGLPRNLETEKVKKLCFDPTDIPKNVVMDSILSPCRNNRDCVQYPNSSCFVDTSKSCIFYDDSTDEMIHNAGLCYSGNPPLSHGLLYLGEEQDFQGNPTKKNETCVKHSDCVHAGNSTSVVPGVNYCNKNTSTGKGVCQLLSTDNGTCPDTVTQHLLEPECSANHTCLKPGGICHLGHCCPGLRFSKTLNMTTEIPKKSYLTNRNCSKSEMKRLKLIRGFCDEQSMKIVVLGTEMDDSEETTELATNGTECFWNRDCIAAHAVCVYTQGTGFCYQHPGFPRPAENDRALMLIKVFGSLSMIFGVSAIISFWSFKFTTGNRFLESWKFLTSFFD